MYITIKEFRSYKGDVQAPTCLKLNKMFYLAAKTCINTNEAELNRSHKYNNTKIHTKEK